VTSKDRTQLIVIGAGVLLLMVFIPMNLMKGKKKPAGPTATPVEAAPGGPLGIPQGASQAPTAMLGALDPDRREKQIGILKGPWGRDPFYHKRGMIPVVRSELVLKGVAVRSDGKTAALINDAIVEEGEEVEGCRVKRIEPVHVILDQNGREIILELQEEEGPAK